MDVSERFVTVAGSDETIKVDLGADPGPGWPVTLSGAETVTAAIGPGVGLPVAFTPNAVFKTPFDASIPIVVLTWLGSETASLDPSDYLVWITIDGRTRQVGTLEIQGAPSVSANLEPIIGVEEARELTAGAIDHLERDAGDVLRSLRTASGDLRAALAERYAAGWRSRNRWTQSELLAEAKAFFESSDGLAAIRADDASKRYVAFRAIWHLMMVPGTSESEPVYRNLRSEAASQSGKALGRVVVDGGTLGEIRMGFQHLRMIR